MAKKYNQAVDLILAAALAFRAGKVEKAATYMQLAADDESFEEGVDAINEVNDDAGEPDGDEVVSRFVRGARKAQAADEDLGDGDLPGGEGPAGDQPAAPPAMRDGENVVAARLRRQAHNKRVLAALTS